jgi:CheY-like chemotaxis protein
MRILLVEDDPLNQKITTQLLSKWPLEISIANDGQEALDQLAAQVFDLVLMDLNIPVMNGFETVNHIRNHSTAFTQIPIFAFTASDAVDTTEKAQQYNMNDTLAKPLNPLELHCKINEHILLPRVDARPVQIRFDLFQQSDSKFERDLLVLMVQNIRDLELACFKAYYAKDTRSYQAAAHKVKSTLVLLNDNAYSYTIEHLKEALISGEPDDMLREKINKFCLFSQSVIKGIHAYMLTLTPTEATA